MKMPSLPKRLRTKVNQHFPEIARFDLKVVKVYFAIPLRPRQRKQKEAFKYTYYFGIPVQN